MNHTELVIDITGLTKKFDKKCAVCGADFQIKKGEIFGFLGPNGSGKTTSMRMMCGLLKPDAGKGHCLGYDILRESMQIKKQVGYMTQNFSLYGDLTARENLEFIARIYQIKNISQAIHQTFQKLKFHPRDQKKLASQLSGGFKQRLSLAGAILHQPHLLLLDEPTSGIDPQARREFWAIIHELSEQGITSLVSTHYLDEAEHCHRLAYIVNGFILTTGTVSHIIQSSQLTLWVVTGKNLPELAQELKLLDGVDEATLFGEKLHVVGRNAQLLSQTIEPYRTKNFHWTQEEPTLEDIFIYLVSTTQEKNETRS